MIKECNVKMRTDNVAVVMFDGQEIQVPTSSLINDVAYIKYEDGVYTVTTKEAFETSKFVKTNKMFVKNSVENKWSDKNTSDNIVIDNEE